MENEKLGVRFTLPEKLSIRQWLAYREAVMLDRANDPVWLRYWSAIVPLLEDWECEAIPDPAALDLDAPTEKLQADIIQWVANQAAEYILGLENVPKND